MVMGRYNITAIIPVMADKCGYNVMVKAEMEKFSNGRSLNLAQTEGQTDDDKQSKATEIIWPAHQDPIEVGAGAVVGEDGVPLTLQGEHIFDNPFTAPICLVVPFRILSHAQDKQVLFPGKYFLTLRDLSCKKSCLN